MDHARGTLKWENASKRQVREVLMRNGISSSTWLEGHALIMGEDWSFGPDIYLIDTLTDRGARVTVQGPEEFDIKISSRTGQELFDDLVHGDIPVWVIDKIVVLD